MDLLAACRDAAPRVTLCGELVRVVESQEQIATLSLVDSLAEQAQLEELLETSKPAWHPEAAGLHYLLATPFRYPPLRHGSRFGGRHEPALFYGARGLQTALAETAYYRFLFWSGMAEPPPAGRLITQHTAFGAVLHTGWGLQLQEEPFLAHQTRLRDPSSYRDTQPLGTAMREAGIEAFEYRSARDADGGINLGLFRPRVFARTSPVWQQSWLCETDAARVTCTSPGVPARSFALDAFLVDGVVPCPGC